MSRESVLPTALIRDLQISIRDSFSLPLSPSDSPPPPPLPSIQEAVAALDPALDASARCGRCSGGYLGGGVSMLCVYCGEGYKGGATAPPEISFVGTIAYKLLLESLGLDGSEAVNLDPDSAEPNKERDSSKAGMTLSNLLDLKLAFSPIKPDVTDIESRTKVEPDPTTYDLNLSGIDLDAVFKESKKETPQIKDTKHTPIQVSSENRTTVTSSFAKWEPDFDSQPVNPSMPVQISVPASENLLKTNQKKEISEIETQGDEEFDEWQDFAGSRATQNLSDMVERVGSPTESREPVKPGGDISFDSKDLATSRLDQSRSSDLEGVTNTSQEENLPIENSESLNVEEEDMFDDWQAFTRSGGDENGAEVKPEFGLPEQVHVKKLEPLSHEDDLFDDSKNFTGPGVAQSGLSVQEEINAFASGDLLTINTEKESAHTEMSHGDVNEAFDEWDDFTGSGLGHGSSLDLEEKSKTIVWDPLNTKNLEEPSNMEVLNADPGDSLDDWKHFTESGVAHVKLVAEEKTQPRTQDRLAVDEVEPSDRGETLHVKFDDFFDGWKDSSSVLARLPDDGGRAEPISDEPKPRSTTEEPSAIGTINVEDDDSFDDWKDSSSVLARLPDDGGRAEPISDEPKSVSTTEQTSAIGTINAEDDDSFDDWKDFTSSSAVESGLINSVENQLPTGGNSSEIFSGWPIGGTESKKANASIDLWSDGVNAVTNSASNNNGNTNLSDGLLDFMLLSQVNGTISNQGAQIANDAEGSSDNWLDFATVTGPTKSRSGNLDFEKKDPDGLFDDWQAFTGSSQSVKPKSNLTEKSSKIGEQKQEDLSEDWLDFTSFSEIKGNPELKTGNNGVSDGWSNFTDMIGVKGSKSKSLSSHDWQEIASTGQVSAPVAYNAQDIDFGDFLQSSSSAAPADHVNFDSSNGLHPDPLSFLSTPGNNIFNPNPNSNVNSKNENASDIQKFLSQMSDLSFMLKDELSIPDKLHSK